MGSGTAVHINLTKEPSSVRHTCNDQDDDKRSLPDASIHPALCPDEDDGDNKDLSSFSLSASLAQSCSFHSLFKLEQSVLLVKLLWHVRVRMMLVEELDGMES